MVIILDERVILIYIFLFYISLFFLNPCVSIYGTRNANLKQAIASLINDLDKSI